MTPYYLGGYYLIRPTTKTFWSPTARTIYSASNCINKSLLDHWSYSWTTGNDDEIDSIKQTYAIDDETIQSIRQWVDKACDDKRTGWINVFRYLDTVKEYQQKFFAHLPDTKIVGTYFRETDVDAITDALMPRGKGFGTEGLYDCLIEKIPETDSVTETFIGFDIAGIDVGGSFHSFYCNLAPEVFTERFGLKINQYGLFEDSDNWKAVLTFMNDKESPVEPVPWFICKIKLVSG